MSETDWSKSKTPFLAGHSAHLNHGVYEAEGPVTRSIVLLLVKSDDDPADFDESFPDVFDRLGQQVDWSLPIRLRIDRGSIDLRHDLGTRLHGGTVTLVPAFIDTEIGVEHPPSLQAWSGCSEETFDGLFNALSHARPETFCVTLTIQPVEHVGYLGKTAWRMSERQWLDITGLSISQKVE